MSEMNRREFLAAAVAMSAACALCRSRAFADDQAADNHPAVHAKDLPPEKFDAGLVTDFENGKGNDKFVTDHQVLLSLEKDKLIALTAVCTHKQILIHVNDKGTDFVCPTKAWFDLQGVPEVMPDGTYGPAGRPLVHYAISIDDKNHVIVDTGTKFKKDKWDDAGAWVKVPG